MHVRRVLLHMTVTDDVSKVAKHVPSTGHGSHVLALLFAGDPSHPKCFVLDPNMPRNETAGHSSWSGVFPYYQGTISRGWQQRSTFPRADSLFLP